MANNWFQFKQFRIQQDACAMKVTTDACLFGAWLANIIPVSASLCHTLDIGTGTGLLSLMLAQQHTHMQIDAIEIDDAAAKQASMNFSSSSFAKQIQVHQSDIFDVSLNKQYDLVISNPPFHQQQLKTNQSTKNIAHHDEGMTLENLFPMVVGLLKDNGLFALLMPFYRQSEILELAGIHQLSTLEICTVKQSEHHPFFRSMFLFGKEVGIQTKYNSMNICDEIPNYSRAFKKLLQPYYLNL